MAFSVVLLALALGAQGAMALAASGPADRCIVAADRAAAEHGVPQAMLRAIALAESGRAKAGRLGPWPWTMNVAGQGTWFETRDDALAAAQAALRAGQRSFDLGCFQINVRWHGENFPSLDAMLDPAASADYAARFLRRLYEETGNWLVAAGHYHSRTPEVALKYRGRVERLLASAHDMAPAGEPRPMPSEPPPLVGPSGPQPPVALMAATPGGVRIAHLGQVRLPRGSDAASARALREGRPAGSVAAGSLFAPAGGGARAALLRPAAGSLLETGS